MEGTASTPQGVPGVVVLIWVDCYVCGSVNASNNHKKGEVRERHVTLYNLSFFYL